MSRFMLATMLMPCLIWADCAHAVLPPDIDACLRNVIAERQKLQSGQCVLRGKRTPLAINAAGFDTIEDFEISVAFDVGRIRMDSAEPGYVVAANQPLKMEMLERRFYRTNTQSAMWIVGEQQGSELFTATVVNSSDTFIPPGYTGRMSEKSDWRVYGTCLCV